MAENVRALSIAPSVTEMDSGDAGMHDEIADQKGLVSEQIGVMRHQLTVLEAQVGQMREVVTGQLAAMQRQIDHMRQMLDVVGALFRSQPN